MSDVQDRQGGGSVRDALRAWFKSPPRAHGEVDQERVVSFLELFYDLVFVVLIAQIAHTLAGDVSWVGVRNFTIVFALIWIAWINGSFYHELHGREDGRSRSSIFIQMTMLVVLSVYASHAADDVDDGRGFAIVYALLLAFIAVQWLGLRRYDTPEWAAMTLRYVVGMGITVAIIVVSVFVPDARLALWAVAAAVTVIGTLREIFRTDPALEEAFHPTESLAERFGLFTIIVLGEVVVGVADGLAEGERTTRTIATGVLALMIGFAFWWNYFDFAGRRQPRRGAVPRGIWNFAHFPMWLGIAAGGAGMVSLIEHAQDGRTPANTAWLVSGAVALMAVGLAAVVSTMEPHPGRRAAPYVLVATAGVSLLIGALRPTPVVLAAALYVVFSFVWMESFVRHARAGTSIVDH